ncbi:probable protein phosphatase CG10417 isoform X2 [Agrilus planipennis]|uniref:protein-serine/threonine phosphatase n=1 Tax=Agrilus planipennis TaxID=224129 RepID=A0A1W4X052_AGRPL|nr:probable protein phosphatase CG10417 isoform X2 [Agrilus planipennis]
MGLCGSYLTYLSKPVTEKISSDEANEKIKCGASSMQGWRESQEDAHNCILDYDTNTSFFAVYDGHGGHEVASYTSLKLPQYIKETEAYKKGKFEEALIDAFLDFDATLTLPEVIDELKKISDERKVQRDDDEEEEDVSSLYEEASMPIEKVIERYTAKLLGAKAKPAKEGCDEKLKKDKCSTLIKENCSSSSDPTSSSISKENCDPQINEVNIDESVKKPDSSNSSSVNTVSSTTTSNDIVGSSEKLCLITKIASDSTQNECSTSNGDLEDEATKSEATAIDGSLLNGGVSQTENNKEKEEQSEKVGSSTSQENGCMSKKDKTKMPIKEENDDKCSIRTRPKREAATKVYNELLNESESDSEDEEDKTFLGSLESSSEEDEIVNSTVEAENEEDEEDAEDDDMDNDDEDDEEDFEEEEEDEESMEFQKNMKDEPGSGSGCTAVVALLRENQLFVANAGDSRCIVCRSGKAVEMSFDHKPEDQPEEERIKKAGGKVTADGRVNGGLNLSRALGDHAYKQNKELSSREQMITALPDVRTLTIKPGEDEFMVLACDGIWNSLSNQEVVDFVKNRIEKGETSMSRICEEMFDTCLAPNTKNDGTGCDNMTAIIVQFKLNTNTNKRSAPDDDNVNAESTENIKRVKTEDDKECTTSS